MLLKKAPKAISYALWIVVAFRLLVPFSFESVFSLIPRNAVVAPISHNIIQQQSTQVNSIAIDSEDVGSKTAGPLTDKSLPDQFSEKGKKPFQVFIKTGAYVWISGMAALLGYSILSILLLRRQLKDAQKIGENIFEANNLRTPFVLGLANPRIYLPAGLSKEDKEYIIIHEKTHIRRKDHVIKTLAFITLSIHWFNPLVWIAFRLMNTDMELSCDEIVLRTMNENIKKHYASLLLSLSAERRIVNGGPLAFGEGDIKERIKNVLNYKKSSFWIIAMSAAAVIIVGIALAANPRQGNTAKPENNLAENPAGASGAAYDTNNKSVKIKYLSGIMDPGQVNDIATNASKVVDFVDSVLQASLTPAGEADLDNNHTNKYMIELSGGTGGYNCELYYDTLYNKAYIARGGDLFEVSTDFARYIDSLFENALTGINTYMVKADAEELFQKYGWTLDYRIGAVSTRLKNIRTLSDFDPNAYYFAYHNVLSKDIGLDMSGYSNTDIDVEIYRVYESMPEAFYPIQNCRGIVVRSNDQIIGAFISAGRHSTFNACSLKGNGFETITGKTLNEWLADMVQPEEFEASLSKLEPEQVIEKYFAALADKDAKTASYCISKETLLDYLSTNIPNDELFNKTVVLPLTVPITGGESGFDNLRSAKLLKTELLGEPDEYTRVFRVTVDLRYKKDVVINSGEQHWDCYMVYESPQTGWKIGGFGH